MNGFSRIYLLGRLGSDPAVQTSKGGNQFTKLNVATNRPNQDESEDKKQTTDWYTVNAWGRQGELCARYLTKGQGVMIEGYLSTYQVEKEDGKHESRIAINASKVEFLQKPLGTQHAAEMVSTESIQ